MLPPDDRATLADVAALAEVSVSTASRVLTGRGEFVPATRRRVFDAAATLGYDRESTARGRRTGSDARIIEMVIGRLAGPWVSRAVVGAHEQAFALGYDLVLTRERDVPTDDWHTRAVGRRSSGVVTTVLMPTAGQVEFLADYAIPIVLLEPLGEPTPDLVQVCASDFRGGFDAGRHLVDRGYDDFMLAAPPQRYRYGRARAAGFREGVASARPGADVEIVDVRWNGRIPTSSVENLVARTERHRVGVFALNDTMAAALVSALIAAGLRVPQDIGVVGFDDVPQHPFRPLSLTSVRQPTRDMAARAVATLDLLRRGDAIPHRRIELPTELIAREST